MLMGAPPSIAVSYSRLAPLTGHDGVLEYLLIHIKGEAMRFGI